MSSRLDQEREARLAPQRIQSTKKKLEELGYYVRAVDHTQLEITLNDGSFVKFWPYSGWHSGKAIEDGRGFDQLLKKLEVANKPRIEYDTREFNGGLDFKPKPYQKEVLDNYHADQNVQLTTGRDGRNRFVGIDHVAKGGDKTVVSQHLKGNHPNMIIFDEASNWPDYKWYRNPIKWLQFRKVMKTLERRHK